MTKPLVSVIMPCYNGEAFLASAVDSVLVQTFKDFELIVVVGCVHERRQQVVSRFAPSVGRQPTDVAVHLHRRCVRSPAQIRRAEVGLPGGEVGKGDILLQNLLTQQRGAEGVGVIGTPHLHVQELPPGAFASDADDGNRDQATVHRILRLRRTERLRECEPLDSERGKITGCEA